MRQEQRGREDSTGASGAWLTRQARDEAHRWLARFAPLLDATAASSAEETRQRLDLIDTLRAESGGVIAGLAARAEPEDAPLQTTLQMAASQLDGLETDLKRRLGTLAPGDPEGMVDLDALRAELSAAAARREIGVSAVATGDRLEMQVSQPNWAAGGMMGIFSLGWLSFTTFHAALMIGGMMAAFGPLALALLLFYGIFWAVGLTMGWTALQALAQESVTLEGRELVVRRRIFGKEWERRYVLGIQSRAYTAFRSTNTRHATFSQDIAILDREGSEVRFGGNAPRLQQQNIVQRMNDYLSRQR